jgi:flagellar biosynthesis protein FliR
MEREIPVKATVMAALAIALAVWVTVRPTPHQLTPVKFVVIL